MLSSIPYRNMWPTRLIYVTYKYTQTNKFTLYYLRGATTCGGRVMKLQNLWQHFKSQVDPEELLSGSRIIVSDEAMSLKKIDNICNQYLKNQFLFWWLVFLLIPYSNYGILYNICALGNETCLLYTSRCV